MTRKRLIAAIAATALMLVVYVLVASPSGTGSMKQFEPTRLASLELRMWQAYYAKQNVRLFALLVEMLREQYHYSWATAVREAFHLARAAATFGNARSNYEQVPDLELAYGTAQQQQRAGFDPKAVARAELAWWVARRMSGQNSPAQVGGLIAEEYALLYEVPRPAVEKAALLRAQAGALRDAQAAQPDWSTIERLLQESYSDLHRALAQER